MPFDMTYAQACGEQPYSAVAFVAGVDFDPSDPDEVEAVMAASEQHRYDRMAELERENDRLRARLSEYDPED